MAFDPARPRETLELDPNLLPGAALVPLQHQNEAINEHHRRYGIIVLIPLEHGEMAIDPHKLVFAIESHSPFKRALDTISALENNNALPRGSARDAFNRMLACQFEQSVWLRYMPTNE